jgi:hypothetical protein
MTFEEEIAPEVSNWRYNDDKTWTNKTTGEIIGIERVSGPFDKNVEYVVFVSHRHVNNETLIARRESDGKAQAFAYGHAERHNDNPSKMANELLD